MKYPLRSSGKLALFVLLSIAFSISYLYSEDFFFDTAGVRIHYIVESKGEPVLLIHGFSSSIQSNWTATGIIKDPANAFQVIALDCRGHRESEKPRNPDAY